jgi:bifunctional non-homologous end joining protein LigD
MPIHPPATLVDEPPEGDGWIHEIKYDGYRTIVAVDGASTKGMTGRRGEATPP